MAEPRCGASDIQEIVDLNYIPWTNENISYAIEKTFSLNMPISEVRQVIRESLDLWSKYIPRNFIEIDNFDAADIKISSQNNFDKNEVANANSKGTLVFDKKLKWKRYKIGETEIPDTLDILAVTVHEIGHILGLKHLSTQETNMKPNFYHFFDLNNVYIQPFIFAADIQSIQSIYGEKKN
uniref:Peptidase metallopeptidase domain-containing protein n=1 Tax=Panagrolaimus davidi TaxID=227884 RepID=A0A914PUF2_9BILA